MVARRGNIHPSIARATSSEPADPTTLLEHLVLPLQSSAEQQAELEQFIAQQSDPASPNFQKFLTPEEFAARFGAHPSDIQTITNWLESRGLQIEEVAPGNGFIVFNGTASRIARAFDTEIRRYTVDGVRHLANATDPKIPAAFNGIVGGVLRLHDFEYQTYARVGQEKRLSKGIAPAFAPAGVRWLTPADYHTIYDITPLLNTGIDGTGQSIAVLARSNIHLSDVQSFRSMFGLKANDPQLIVTNTDPGTARGADTVETTLDTEWAGAVAPGATIKVIISSSTSSADGIDLSAMYAVTRNIAPIITVSYGACEAQLGATALAFYNSLWQQASAQGQTVLVASGDSGAAGCDKSSAKTAVGGKAVNGLCSSPYATCVGGTQFNEGSNPATYWMPTNPGSTAGSAIGYIPEVVWNESGTTSLAAGGGGASTIYAKPAWQAGPGVPADGKRDVPDVSLTAAAHDGYAVVHGGALKYTFGVAGTSASTPSFAGIIALVNQKTSAAQGNINPILYGLAAKQATAGAAAIFHDIKTGNNSVPGLTGFTAATGYDQATGLGSVDANLLATMWYSASATAPSLSVFGNAVSINPGQTGTTTVTTALTGTASAVALSVSGLPTGVTATFTPTSIPSPGSGSSALKFTAATNALPGIYTIQLTATAGAKTATSSLKLTITQPTFTLTSSTSVVTALVFGPTKPYAAQTIRLQTLPSSGFNSAITLSASGLPTGMAVSFSPATTPATTSVTNVVATVTAADTVRSGSYAITINATGGGVTQSLQFPAVVLVRPSCAFAVDQTSFSVKPGTPAVVTLSCKSATPNTTPVNVSVTGVPAGVTAQLSAPTISAGQTVRLTLTATTAAVAKVYPLIFNGVEDNGAKQNLYLYAAVNTPVFSLSLNPAIVNGLIGRTTQFVALATPEPGFNSPLSMWIYGLPTGVTAALTAPPAGTMGSTVTLTIASTAKAGTYPIQVGASISSGFSRTVNSSLVLTVPPPLTVTTLSPAVSLRTGSTAPLPLTTKASGSFNALVAMSVTGLPTGVTAQFSSPTVAAPGNGNVTMTLKSASTARPGTYSIRVTGTGGGTTASVNVGLTINP